MQRLNLRLGVLFLLAAASPIFAQDADEAREGWLKLFDGKTTFGWKADDPKTLTVENGELVVSEGTATFSVPFASFKVMGDFSSEGAVRLTSAVKSLEIPFGTGMTRFREDYTRLADAAAPPLTLITLKAFPGKSLRVARLSVRPTGLGSIFNDKDLSGWKIFPGKKSTFEVDGGVLRVKDGPGDLQTEKKYGDFLLQLECKTHGKHLNSGVFFRCRDGEYQNGYEAQIRNQFTPEATQDYVIEEYDPKTRMLLEKKKVKSTAFDFGTGAIYRRVPARVGVARDGEWFTMTVVAHANHLATFVDGILVADWHDWRPLSDNARTGCRLAAGHISLQGHDPTTDLSFRNFRIAEYGK